MQELSYTTHRMEFAFLTNSMMSRTKGYFTPQQQYKEPLQNKDPFSLA